MNANDKRLFTTFATVEGDYNGEGSAEATQEGLLIDNCGFIPWAWIDAARAVLEEQAKERRGR